MRAGAAACVRTQIADIDGANNNNIENIFIEHYRDQDGVCGHGRHRPLIIIKSTTTAAATTAAAAATTTIMMMMIMQQIVVVDIDGTVNIL